MVFAPCAGHAGGDTGTPYVEAIRPTLACTSARIGTPDGWAQRAALVRANGIDAVVAGSLERWFGPGFRDREPATVSALVAALRACDAESYARVCEALGAFDAQQPHPHQDGVGVDCGQR